MLYVLAASGTLKHCHIICGGSSGYREQWRRIRRSVGIVHDADALQSREQSPGAAASTRCTTLRCDWALCAPVILGPQLTNVQEAAAATLRIRPGRSRPKPNGRQPYLRTSRPTTVQAKMHSLEFGFCGPWLGKARGINARAQAERRKATSPGSRYRSANAPSDRRRFIRSPYARVERASSSAGRLCTVLGELRAAALWLVNVVAHLRHLSAIRFHDALLSGSRAARAERSQSAACFKKSSGRFMGCSSALS